MAFASPLSEVVARVLEEHPDVRSAAALMRAADSVITQARSEFLPTVGVEVSDNAVHERQSGAAGYDNRRTRRSDAVARWTLFNGYADWFSNRAAERGREAAGFDLEEAREGVAQRIAEIYVEVLRLEEQLTHARAYEADLSALFSNVEARATAGRIPMVELEQARSRLIHARWELSQQRAQIAAARNAFRQVTGLEATDLRPPLLDPTLTDGPLPELLARAEEHSPRLAAARERARARDADVGVAQAEFLPRLSLESRKRVSTAPDTSQTTDTARSNLLQLSLHVPLGGKNFARHNELVERKFAAQADADSKLIDLKSNVGEQQSNLVEARAMAPLLKEKLAAAARVVEAYRLQFDAGRRSLLDLLTVREDQYQTQTLESSNRHGRIVTAARLARQMGALREALGQRTSGTP